MRQPLRQTLAILRLGWLFLYELLLSSLQVAWDVITPQHLSRPGILAIPLTAETDAEITVLSNLMCLTPGTLSLDVSADRRHLYIHAMFIEDPAIAVQTLKEKFERRVLEAMR